MAPRYSAAPHYSCEPYARKEVFCLFRGGVLPPAQIRYVSLYTQKLPKVNQCVYYCMMAISRKNKKIEEEKERLDVLGQESDKKAVKWVKEDAAGKKKTGVKNIGLDLEKLDSSRRGSYARYKSALGKIIYEKFQKLSWPKGFRFGVFVTKKGIECHIYDPFKRKFARGITPTYEPKFDLNAAQIMAVQADNTIAILMGEAQARAGHITPNTAAPIKQGGIWVPPTTSPAKKN